MDMEQAGKIVGVFGRAVLTSTKEPGDAMAATGVDQRLIACLATVAVMQAAKSMRVALEKIGIPSEMIEQVETLGRDGLAANPATLRALIS